MCKFPHRGKENACTERKQKLEGLNGVHSFLWVSPREERRVFFSLLDSMVIADCEKTLQVFQLYLFLFSFYFSSFDQDVGKSVQTEKILRSHSSNKECTFFPISSWSFSIEEKILFESIDKHTVKSYLGDINIWGKTRIFFKNNQKLIIIIMNRCIRFSCTNLNFVSINRIKKALGITQWSHLVIKPDHIISLEASLLVLIIETLQDFPSSF